MTRSIISSGGSLSHVSSLAWQWFCRVEQTTAWSLHTKIQTVQDAIQIAERFCAIVSCPLSVLTARASGRPSVAQPLLEVPEILYKSVDLTCNEIKIDSTRYTARSRAKWGIRLVRFVVTLARTGDLNLIITIAVKISDSTNEVSVVEDIKSPAATSEVDSDQMAATEARLTILKNLDCDSLFRKAITAAGVDLTRSVAGLDIPENFGLDLQDLQRLTQKMLGMTRVRGDVQQAFERASPQIVQCEYTMLPAYMSYVGSQYAKAEGLEETVEGILNPAVQIDAKKTTRHFQRPQWELVQNLSEKADNHRYSSTIKSIRRRRVLIEDPAFKPAFSYGTLQKIEAAFATGVSIIVTGVSGTGKSTLLAKLPTEGATVFQLGGESDGSRPKHFVYVTGDVDQLIKKASRTSGRKILISHEFFIGPGLLERLGIFDQFAFVGDPRQPGAWGDGSHLFRFIKDIGGRSFTLSVVWRASNPLSMMTVNYFAYGSRFKICTRNFQDKRDVQFELIFCEDSVMATAACMLAYALQKVEAGKSVMIGASRGELIHALKQLLSLASACPDGLHCRHISDLQGREADVVVVDLHDIAVSNPTADDALRFFIMLLGRARQTTCFALGPRNMAVTPEAALPIEVYAGIVLRHRVRSTETKTLKRSGPNFEKLSSAFNLVFIDEETIALMNRINGITDIMFIKSHKSHNAEMIKGTYSTIEFPEIFSDCDIEEHCSVLSRLATGSIAPKPGKVHTVNDVKLFFQRNR